MSHDQEFRNGQAASLSHVIDFAIEQAPQADWKKLPA